MSQNNYPLDRLNELNQLIIRKNLSEAKTFNLKTEVLGICISDNNLKHRLEIIFNLAAIKYCYLSKTQLVTLVTTSYLEDVSKICALLIDTDVVLEFGNKIENLDLEIYFIYEYLKEIGVDFLDNLVNLGITKIFKIPNQNTQLIKSLALEKKNLSLNTNVAVVGATGGVGATTINVCLAQRANEIGKNAILVDTDIFSLNPYHKLFNQNIFSEESLTWNSFSYPIADLDAQALVKAMPTLVAKLKLLTFAINNQVDFVQSYLKFFSDSLIAVVNCFNEINATAFIDIKANALIQHMKIIKYLYLLIISAVTSLVSIINAKNLANYVREINPDIQIILVVRKIYPVKITKSQIETILNGEIFYFIKSQANMNLFVKKNKKFNLFSGNLSYLTNELTKYIEAK